MTFLLLRREDVLAAGVGWAQISMIIFFTDFQIFLVVWSNKLASVGVGGCDFRLFSTYALVYERAFTLIDLISTNMKEHVARISRIAVDRARYLAH